MEASLPHGWKSLKNVCVMMSSTKYTLLVEGQCIYIASVPVPFR